MAGALKKNQKVSWESSHGEIKGKVVETIKKPMEIKDHHVAASAENPEVVVKSDKTGAIAAHKPESLKKVK